MPEKITLPKGTVIPNHIAVILDGNRRWARARGLKPWEGHKAGYEAVRKLARAARDMGVHTFTIWAFSTENWERPPEEIKQIMALLKKGLAEFEKDAHKEKVRLVHLGRKDRFPKELGEFLTKMEEKTKNYTKNILNLALDYGGRDEIVRATKKIIESKVQLDKIDEKLFESYLDTRDEPFPYVDLFIRTSGEQRTSGLLPWQMTYAEIYWEEDNLPDMNSDKLKEAILDYSRRRRRFGANDDMEHLKFKPELAAKFELAWWRLQNIPEGTKFSEYAVAHLKEQYGLSKGLAKDAAKLMVEAFWEGKDEKWHKAGLKLKKFYKLIKDEVKLAFEPSIVASLEVKTWQNRKDEGAATDLVAETYRISEFQARKAGHLRVLAQNQKELALNGGGEDNWQLAHEYLLKYYKALKDRVA